MLREKQLLVLHIDNQNTMYVLAFKGTQTAYLTLNFQWHQSVQLLQIMQLEIELILDKVK